MMVLAVCKNDPQWSVGMDEIMSTLSIAYAVPMNVTPLDQGGDHPAGTCRYLSVVSNGCRLSSECVVHLC